MRDSGGLGFCGREGGRVVGFEILVRGLSVGCALA